MARVAVDIPAGSGRSDTLAMRCTGTWPGESANAHPLDRSNPVSLAILRSSW
ncbi:hypothetical protein STENM223S_03828 [Streptomyces tendae]